MSLLPVAFAAIAACSPSPSVQAEGSSSAGWELAWSDEFDSHQVDPDSWNFEIDCWGGGNEERQCYTDDPRNAAVVDGKLVITARDEDHTGPAWPVHLQDGPGNPDAVATKPFTSARLTTSGKASWRYGKIEIRAKLPQGQGVWPAIWMLPQENRYGTWAASGEIDILEAVNLGVICENDCEVGGENTILGTLHFGGLWPDNDLASTEIEAPQVLEGFHTFGVVWEEGRFRWMLDGEIYAEKTSADWWSAGSADPNAPFDQEFFLILNLAIGGGLPEERALGGVSNEGFPKQFEIDWVRVWKCSGEVVSDLSCKAGDRE